MIGIEPIENTSMSYAKQRKNLKLRLLDKQVYILNNIKNKWGLNEIELDQLNSEQKYFQFSGNLLGKSTRIYWPVNDLLNHYLPENQLDLSLIEPDFAIQLANDFLETSQNFLNIYGVELIKAQNIIFGKEYRKLLYRYINTSATIWLETIDKVSNPENQSNYLNIKFDLNFLLGSAALSVKQLKRLSVGDIVRIGKWQKTIYSASQLLYAFDLNATSIIVQGVNQMEDPLQEMVSTDISSALDIDKSIDIKSLPIQCQFYLPSKEFEYEQLNSLAVGDVLPLTHDAISHVHMQIGRQHIAEGELVQIDNEVGFEIKQVYLRK